MSTDTGIMNMEDRYTLTDLPEIFTAYYVVDWHSLIFAKGLKDFDGEGYELTTCGVIFAENAGDYSRIAAGMAFKTQEAAERNKYAVYKALTGKEWKREDARHE